MRFLSLDEQHARLRTVNATFPIVQLEGEPMMLVLELPDGRQILSPLEGEKFDLWTTQDEPARFGLTLDEARAEVE